MINAKQTYYKGYHFRSRTEARWAVFFDAMQINYEYEKEDVLLSSGRYLPDFWLPNFGTGGSYAEVKGTPFTDDEKSKCFQLQSLSGRDVIMLDGVPDFKSYTYIHPVKWPVCSSCPDFNGHLCAEDKTRIMGPGSHDGCKGVLGLVPGEVEGVISSDMIKYGERMYAWPEWDNGEQSFIDYWYKQYHSAIYKSRSARFEFN